MARRRYISTSISVDTRVNRLAVEWGDFAALLYTWLIPHADDQGELPDDPEQLLFMVLPGRRDRSVDDVTTAIDGMVQLELLDRGGGVLRYPPSFHRYQSYIKEQRRESAQNAARQRTSAQPVAPVLSPVPVSSPVSEDENLEGELPPSSAAVAAIQKQHPVPVPLVKLSDEARTLLEHWRLAYGKRSPPKLNPTEAAKLEDALADLGLDRLTEAVTYMAGRGVEPLAKAISAAKTKRLNDEQDRSNGHGEDRQHSGRAGAGSGRAHAGPGAGGAGEDDPFAKYVIRDEPASGDPGSP